MLADVRREAAGTGRTVGRLALVAGATGTFLALGAAATPAHPEPVPPTLPPVVELVCEVAGVPVVCPADDGPPATATPSAVAPLRPPDVPSVATTAPPAPPAPPAIVAATPAPAPAPAPPVSATARDSPPSRPPAKPSSGDGDDGDPAYVRRGLALPRPQEVELSARSVVLATSAGALGLVLIGFPADLFNRTLRENYGRLRRLLPWVRGEPAEHTGRNNVVAFMASCVLAGGIGAVQKVHAWTLAGALTVAASIALGALVTLGAYEAGAAVVGRRLGLPARRFRAFPGALPVVALCVAVSTMARLEPAYVYGHLAGFVRPPGSGGDGGRRGRAVQHAVASIVLLGVAVAAWAARAVVTGLVPASLLAGVTVVALNRLAFGLVPVTYLDGAEIAGYSRRLWASVYAPVIACFVLLVLLPSTDRSGSAVLTVSLVLFVGYGALSLLVWAWFRRRPVPALGAGTL